MIKHIIMKTLPWLEDRASCILSQILRSWDDGIYVHVFRIPTFETGF